MNLNLTHREQDVVRTAETFTRDMVVPHAASWEQEKKMPVDTLRAAGREGLLGLLVSEKYGGQGISYTAVARVMEEFASGCMFFAFSAVVHNNQGNSLSTYGSQEQVERFIPGLISGERIGAFCLTEPDAGSDAAAISTRAEPVERGWLVNGEKAWVTNGAAANMFSVYAQTDPAAGWRGLVCILVEDTSPGLERGEVYQMMGGHAMGTAMLKLTDCLLPAENLLIGKGEAFKAAMKGIDLARTLVGAMCCGMVRSSLKCALKYASKRTVFGRAVTDFQGNQWQLADVATNLEASRLLTYDAARALDAGENATVKSAHAKKFSTRTALTDISTCMQVMGAEGYRDEHPLGRHLAGAKMAQYLDGTTEIQNVVISRAMIQPRFLG